MPPSVPWSPETLLIVALALHLLQTIYYYPRLPKQMITRWDLEWNPTQRFDKSLYLVVMLAAVGGLSAAILLGPPILLVPLGWFLLFLLVMNQYIYTANLGDGSLHPSFLPVVIAMVVLFLVALVRNLPRAR